MTVHRLQLRRLSVRTLERIDVSPVSSDKKKFTAILKHPTLVYRLTYKDVYKMGRIAAGQTKVSEKIFHICGRRHYELMCVKRQRWVPR